MALMTPRDITHTIISSVDSTPIDNPMIVNLMPTWGCVLIGAFLGQSLWAISTLQTFTYYKNYEHDRLSLKLLVIAVWLMGTANQALVLKSVFITILKYGSIVALASVSFEMMLSMLVSAAIACVVQIYYVHRIYRFAGKKLWIIGLTIIWITLSFWQVVVSIVYFVIGVGKPYELATRPFSVFLNMTSRLAAVFVDTTLSLCMVWILIYKYQTRVPKTRQMVHRVMVVTINSGIWTAIMALIVLILTKAFPNDFYFVALLNPMYNLYLNSFLGNLNARSYIRGDGTVHTAFGIHNPAAPITRLEFRDVNSCQGTDTLKSSHVVNDKQDAVISRAQSST